jgi:hypothetical protein
MFYKPDIPVFVGKPVAGSKPIFEKNAIVQELLWGGKRPLKLYI